MSNKYTNTIKGNSTGIVQGDGATVIIQDGKITKLGSPRRVKCRACKQRVPTAAYCSACGQPL